MSLTVIMFERNCFVCYHSAMFGPLRFLFPIRGFCNHRSKPSFKISKFSLVLMTSINISLCISIISSLSDFSKFCQRKSFSCFIFLSDLVFNFSGLFLGILFTVKILLILQESFAWSEIFNFQKYHKLDVILNTKKIKNNLIKWRILFCLFFFIFIFATLARLFYFSSSWNNFNIFLIVSNCCFQFLVVLYFFHKLLLIGVILESINIFIKSKNVFSSKTVYTILTINKNIKMVMFITTTIEIVVIFSSVMFLIFNIYLLLDYENLDFFTFIILQFRTSSVAFALLLMCILHDSNLTQKVSYKLYCPLIETIFLHFQLKLIVNYKTTNPTFKICFLRRFYFYFILFLKFISQFLPLFFEKINILFTFTGMNTVPNF